MDQPDEDALLLRSYAVEGSERAFTQLVSRKVDLIYSVALRQVGGDPHLAAEVTQAVFVDLASKAKRLKASTTLTGWLYRSAIFESKKLWRRQVRGRRRQQEGYEMQTLQASDDSGNDWNEIRPLIDEAMMGLSPSAPAKARWRSGWLADEYALERVAAQPSSNTPK